MDQSRALPPAAVSVAGNHGVQFGVGNVLNLHPPRPDVRWPVRVGVVPQEADCYQHRGADLVVQRVLAAGGTAVLVPATTAVLSGLGGVGKTQVAARHARRAWADPSVDLVVWVSAVSRESVITGYAEAAARLLTSIEQTGAEESAAALLAWLGATTRQWLVILDDLRNPADLRNLWPVHSPSGQVVVTTRRRDAAIMRADRHVVEIGVFTNGESIAYLTSKLPAHAGSEQLLLLAEELGHLPLAMAQAAAFIADKPLLTVPTYRERLTDRRKVLAELLPEVDSLPDDHQATVSATWSLSVERADQLTPVGLARPLLELAALLDPTGIPTSLFTSKAVCAALTLRVGRQIDAEAAGDALGCLHRLSLITLDIAQSARAVRVHALVQRATRDTLAPEVIAESARTVADALLEIWPAIETDTALAQSLRANANTLYLTCGSHLWSPKGHELLFRNGRSLGEAGLLRDAIATFEHLRDQTVLLLGPDHPDLLGIRTTLASWHGEAGNPARAVADFEQLLKDHLRMVGPDHPDTLTARNNLALWRGEAGDPAGVMREFERLLADRVRVLGADHPDTLTTRHNLARWHGVAGDPTRAVRQFESLLADRVRVLGADHPDTLTTRNTLASWRAEAGDPAGAVTELERLLEDRVRVLGADHPSTLTTRNNLASCRGQAGHYAAALAEFESLLTDRLRVLGPEHPNTLTTRHNIAYWRGMTGDSAGAVADFESLLADRQRILGPAHPSTLTTRNNLARWRGESGDPVGALIELELLLADRLRVLAPDHPNILTTRHNIAYWRAETGHLTAAITDFEQLLIDHNRVLGPNHPHTVAVRNNLAAFRGEAGDPGAAASELDQLLAEHVRLHGPDHPHSTAITRNLRHWRNEVG